MYYNNKINSGNTLSLLNFNGLNNYHGNYDSDPVFGYKIHKDMTIVAGRDVYDTSDLGCIAKFVASHIEGGFEPGSFLVTNLTAVISQYKQWVTELPMIEPHYAVKCNPDPVILRLLASLGCKFDCATMGEIDLVLNGLGDYEVSADSIVYANPAKMTQMIQFAMDNEVRTTVFDGEDELYKMAAMYGSDSKLDLLIRLDTCGADSVCNLSNKFGCPVEDAPRLLEIAQKLGLNVVGVCFHVGSGCRNAKAYADALHDTFLVFEAAKKLGMNELRIVDIGGGFPGDTGGYGGSNMPTFQEIASVIRYCVKDFRAKVATFQSTENLRFNAEPGRYFASAATSIATKVYSRKGGNKRDMQILYIDDGVYGSFNNIIYDHATPVPSKVQLQSNNTSANGTNHSSNSSVTTTGSNSPQSKYPKKNETAGVVTRPTCVTPSMSGTGSVADSGNDDARKITVSQIYQNSNVSDDADYVTPMSSVVFGPTCDGLDQICDAQTLLPRCRVGDWLLWDNMGAYTHTASFVFNGYTHIPNKIHVVI